MVRAGLAAILASTTLVFACTAADPIGTPLEGQGGDAGTTTNGTTTQGDAGSATCAPSTPPAPQDPSKLPQCCMGGAAHCVPTNDVPPAMASQLQGCTGSDAVCVPDVFITNPSLVPASCKSLNNADGVCLSVCVPQVAMYETLLPQATCASDERCAPCINPLTNMSSGACDIGKQTTSGGTCTPAGGPDAGSGSTTPPADAAPAPAVCPYTGPPLIDPSTLQSCDPAGGAHCVDASLVPPAMAMMLAPCTTATGLCAPDVFIEAGGNYIPPTCSSVDGAEGRCLDEMIPQVAAQKAQLPQATCQVYERCVPCYSPLDGTATGACKLSCDPGPKDPPKLFTNCCTPSHATATQGKCVPTSQVPTAEQSDLNVDECVKGMELCVPTEMLAATFTPPTCTGTAFLTGSYTGVCLSTCLSFGIEQLGIAQGTCDDLHECVPCKNPLTGASTGAPGCPT